MKSKLIAVGGSVVFVAAIVAFVYFRFDGRDDRLRYEREETRVIVSNIRDAQVTLFRAGRNLQNTVSLPHTNDEQVWLPKANYFLKVELYGQTLFYPVPIISYRGGPDKDGTFTVTVRPTTDSPPVIALTKPTLFSCLAVIFCSAIASAFRNRTTCGWVDSS